MNYPDKIKAALFGVAVGDALGVPVEFISRRHLSLRPVTHMTGQGTHHQPAGTWSDDSSLTFCLAEMLCGTYSLADLAARFIAWQDTGYWTANGRVFDIGMATADAIQSLRRGADPSRSGGTHEDSNGNGSLMRILPLAFYIADKPIAERFRIVKEISAVTHAHIRSVVACFIYLELALQLLAGKEKMEAFETMRAVVNTFLTERGVCPQQEINRFHRVLVNAVDNYDIDPIYKCSVDTISSSGYVVSTLEAGIWCLLTAGGFKETVLKAVNLGHDSDTTGAVTGGLAGIYYGFENIPVKWRKQVKRSDDILDLAERMINNRSI